MEYTGENRGKFQHDKRARQLLRFDGMRYGNITPTDIDCCWEYHDKAFFFAEIKYGDAEVPSGQRLLNERQATRIWKSGAYALWVVARHQVHDPEDDVYVNRDAVVTEVFYNGEYKHDFGGKWRTVGECSDAFYNYVKDQLRQE